MLTSENSSARSVILFYFYFVQLMGYSQPWLSMAATRINNNVCAELCNTATFTAALVKCLIASFVIFPYLRCYILFNNVFCFPQAQLTFLACQICTFASQARGLGCSLGGILLMRQLNYKAHLPM